MKNLTKNSEYKKFLERLKEEIASAARNLQRQRGFPDMKGFSRENLWRMKKLYEAYKDYPKLSPLVTVLAWSHNLLILFQAQTIEEKVATYKTKIIDKKLLKQRLHSLPFIEKGNK